MAKKKAKRKKKSSKTKLLDLSKIKAEIEAKLGKSKTKQKLKEKIIEKPLKPIAKQVVKKVTNLQKETKPAKKLDTTKEPKALSNDKKTKVFDMTKVKAEINEELKRGNISGHEAQLKEQRAPAEHVMGQISTKKKSISKYIQTGVPGFDDLFDNGIPKGNAVLVAGGAGSGKTIFCLQTLNYHSIKGDKCFYMSFEESEERLISHMEEFGWNPRTQIKKGNLMLKRMSPFEMARNVEGMLEREKGELLIDIDPVVLPENYKPNLVVVDSLTAVASAFTGKEDSYRIYIEQLFRFFEKLGATVFLITETKQIPEVFSTTGVEEFLADGVVVMYNFKRGDIRENAIEVLKMRGERHKKKIVASQITGEGIVVYPEQEVFGGLD